MYRHLLTISAVILLFALVTACGGVASNPTIPPIPQGGQGPNPPGGTDKETNQGLPAGLGGQAQEQGEEILQGNYEQLWPQGMDAMEKGQIVNAAQFFMSAYAVNQQSAEAALAYAITDVMRDHRKYAVFLHPGVDRLFMNTPLIGHSEVFPNPFLTEDSYFLRLAALGNNIRKLYPAAAYPVVGPADSELSFNAETLKAIKALKEQMDAHQDAPGQAGTPPPVGGPADVPDESGGAPIAPDNPNPDEHPTGYDPPKDLSNVYKDMPPKVGPVKQGTMPPDQIFGSIGDRPPDNPEGAGGGPTAGLGGIAPPATLPERQETISEDEWANFMTSYRETAQRDGADIIISASFRENLARLHEGIQEQISNLEAVRTIAEAPGFSLSLPFNALDGAQKVTLLFDVDDYHLILDYYKMLDSLLKYVEAYNSDVPYFLTSSEIEDKNTDNILSPDEYLPPAPFGTLTEEGKDELGAMLSEFIVTLSGLSNDMQPLLSAAREFQAGDPEPKELFFLSSFQRNFIMIETWTQLLQDISEKSSNGMAIKLAGGDGIEEVVALYDALFLTPLEDVRGPLPSYSLDTKEVVTDAEGNFSSDATFGGFFPEKLLSAGSYITSGKFRSIIFNETMGRAAGSVFQMGDQQAEADEHGLVTVANAAINELIGTDYTVSNEAGEQVKSGSMRTTYELIPLFSVEEIALILNPVKQGIAGEGSTGTPPVPAGGSGAAAGTSGEPAGAPTGVTPDETDGTNDEGDGTGAGDEEEPDDTDGDENPDA